MVFKSVIWRILGLSVVLTAIGIWFFSDHHTFFGYGIRGWFLPHHRMMAYGGMGIFRIVFWAAVFGAVALLISSLFTPRRDADHAADQPQNAIEILKRRYAAGELDKTQFDAMRRDLD